MRVAILGYGSQGRSAYKYWCADGHEVTICDANEQLTTPENAQTRLGADYLSNLHEFDLLVRTPILHPNQIAEANQDHPEVLTKVTTVTSEFFRVCPSRNIIGVTGTKGKGTTSTLIAKILEAAGHRVHLGGNIGIPPLNMLKDNIQPDDWVVLELANFQLIDLSFSPRIAVCLMVEPEHLDWHTDVDEYIAAKQQLFVHQKSDNIAIYYSKNSNSKRIVSVSSGKLVPYMERPGAFIDNNKVVIDGVIICETDELKLLGRHNWQNVCAAVTAVWSITQETEAIAQALKKFTGLPFRIEDRATIDGVTYFNDSFATAPGATIAAIEAITAKKVMLLGGYDRGLDLTELTKVIQEHDADIRKTILIGASAKRLQKALNDTNYKNYELVDAKNMNEIVKHASSVAKPGDAVVLSPAFASFDMFKNFEERGRAFNEAINKL